MPISREKKAQVIKNLAASTAKVPSVVFVNFHGLTVAAMTELRRALRLAGIRLTVAKKTLIRRAFSEHKLEGAMPELPGEVAVAYAGSEGEVDAVAPAREVQEFVKKFKDNLSIIGGVFEGKYADAGLMRSIALIPGREVLYGQLLNLLQSPVRKLAMSLSQIASKK